MTWDRYARVRRSRWTVPALGILWIAVLGLLAQAADAPDPGAAALLALAAWLLAVPGLIGMALGRWWWLAPVVVGLALFALRAPAGLGSTIGNLSAAAALVAVAPAVAMTALGVAFWAPPPPPDPEDEDDDTSALTYRRPRWRRMLRI